MLAKIRWAVFCAATNRPFRKSLDWDAFYEIAATEASYDEKLEAYGRLAEERLDAAAFAEFEDEHFGDLEEIAREYFGTDDARAAVREKVAALYPEHEIDEFTERFWADIQVWRESEATETTT